VTRICLTPEKTLTGRGESGAGQGSDQRS
jgi:hypothetical protein